MAALGAYAPMQYARREQDNSQRDRRDDCESYHSHDQGPPSGTRDLTEIGVEPDAGKREQKRPLRHVGEVGGLTLAEPVRGRDR